MLQTTTAKIRFIESIFGKGNLAGDGINFDVRCPFCAPNDHKKKKLAIRLVDDANHCWTCGWKSRTLAPLLKKLGLNLQLNDYLKDFLNSDIFISEEVKNEIRLPKDFRLIVFGNDHDPDCIAIKRYLNKRGLTDDDLWYHKIGYSNEPRWYRRVIIPSYDDRGNLNYFVTRAIDANKKPKYDNPNIDKNLIIFGEQNINWLKPITLCEGVFDGMKCGSNSIPLLGSDLNEDAYLFNKILAHSPKIVIALDGDMWSKKTPKLVKSLEKFCIDVVVADTRGIIDPGSETKSVMAEIINSAQCMTWDNIFHEKLNNASRTKLSI